MDRDVPQDYELRPAATPTGEPSRKRQHHSTDESASSPITDGGQQSAESQVNRRKAPKVSRACDFCKHRKGRCSGTLPCDVCVKRGLACVYDAKYSRGHPPEPRPSIVVSASPARAPGAPAHTICRESASSTGADARGAAVAQHHSGVLESHGMVSRGSPELGVAEIHGHIFDTTSGITFLDRACRRLSKHRLAIVPDEHYFSPENQPLMAAGDKPLPEVLDDALWSSPTSTGELGALLDLYFDVCIATYRVVHRQTVEAWLVTLQSNIRDGNPLWQDLGRARASIVLSALAIATAHSQKAKGIRNIQDEEFSLSRSDSLFSLANQMTEAETGIPSLESAQARVIQVLYLLTTSRMNQAWYKFGNTFQIVSALGMHRKALKKRHLTSAGTDYIQTQCRIRTFWTCYILDKYLGVMFGRPRHFHDDDVDQEFPDMLEDDQMTPQGPLDQAESNPDCRINALTLHAKLAQIVGGISREVYSIKPISEQERVNAAHRLTEELHSWHANLPSHLGSVRPSMLIPVFRRQSTALKLAYLHAVMQANRLFLLGNLSSRSQPQVVECVEAARDVLQNVDSMASDGPVFHAFWWTQYVTFCALLIAYIWDIQHRRRNAPIDPRGSHAKLMVLAERCQTHLAKATATNSPSRRYAVILEEFRLEAMKQVAKQENEATIRVSESGPEDYQPSHQLRRPPTSDDQESADLRSESSMDLPSGNLDHETGAMPGWSLLDNWDTTDWLDLDSSAFGLFDTDINAFNWIPSTV